MLGKKLKGERKAFSLIELSIVLAILSTLVLFAYEYFSRLPYQARLFKAREDLSTLKTTLGAFLEIAEKNKKAAARMRLSNVNVKIVNDWPRTAEDLIRFDFNGDNQIKDIGPVEDISEKDAHGNKLKWEIKEVLNLLDQKPVSPYGTDYVFTRYFVMCLSDRAGRYVTLPVRDIRTDYFSINPYVAPKGMEQPVWITDPPYRGPSDSIFKFGGTEGVALITRNKAEYAFIFAPLLPELDPGESDEITVEFTYFIQDFVTDAASGFEGRRETNWMLANPVDNNVGGVFLIPDNAPTPVGGVKGTRAVGFHFDDMMVRAVRGDSSTAHETMSVMLTWDEYSKHTLRIHRMRNSGRTYDVRCYVDENLVGEFTRDKRLDLNWSPRQLMISSDMYSDRPADSSGHSLETRMTLNLVKITSIDFAEQYNQYRPEQ